MAMYEKLVSDLRRGKEEQFLKTSSQIDYERQLDQMKLRFDKLWMRKPEPSGSLEGFNICAILGAGAFGKVVLVRQIETDKYFAMKIQEKELLVKTKQIQHTLYEKRILQAINHPFLVNMECCFKDNTYIYFVMPFVNGGDLFTQLRRARKFQDDRCKFYASQVVLALEYIHHLHLVYRDLKPENILLCNDGYLKITDFGFCKYVRSRTWTLCGTPDYLAPEIILSKGYGQSVDWWSFGVLVYEMAAGFAPFYDADQMVTYEKIVGLKYRYPSDFSMEVKDLIRNLLQVDLSRRYGILKRGVYDIKNHAYFKAIDWMKIFQKTVQPPYIPDCESPGDTKYFDSCGEIVLTVDNYDKYEKEFIDF